MKNAMRLLDGCLLLALFSGCAEQGSSRIQIGFPDEKARALVKALEIWALQSDPGECDKLIAETVRPGDGELEILAHQKVGYPLEGSAPLLQGVPVGRVTFFIEGLGGSGEILLRGCQPADLEGSGDSELSIQLNWVCEPQEEQCENQIDDDCDGITDSDCHQCEQDIECDDHNPCTIDFCASSVCHHNNFPNQTPCSDESLCTSKDTCIDGICQGIAKDCSAFDGPCQLGNCIPATGVCGPIPRDDDTPCDDGRWCTTEDLCKSGGCTGAPRDCADLDSCTRDSCNEGESRCDHVRVPKPGAEGPPGDPSCSNGLDDDCDQRIDGDDTNCSNCTADAQCDDLNPCTEDRCLSMICQNSLAQEGTACNDELFCTTRDACSSGVCLGTPRDCSESLPGPCEEAVCLEAQQLCQARPKSDGSPCDDQSWCSVGDHCVSGVCEGTLRDCNDENDCTKDSCDEEGNLCANQLEPIPGAEDLSIPGSCDNSLDDDCDGLTDLADTDCVACTQAGDCDDQNPCTRDLCENSECQNLTEPNDTSCEDGQWCTVGDHCLEGQCQGMARSCAELSDACHEGVCDGLLNQCVSQPKGDGTQCEDNLWCTTGDICSDGACAGSPRECDDNDPCTQEQCDEDKDQCVYTLTPIPDAEGPPGHSSCDNQKDDDCDALTDLEDPDCYDCQGDLACQDNNPCTQDRCLKGLCQNESLPDGSSCDDGLLCTEKDSCTQAVCRGTPRDCTSFEDSCHLSTCDASTGDCVVEQLSDGTPCNDQDWCTLDDVCASGSCSGRPRDCSDAAGKCQVGVCDSLQSLCVAKPVQDGTSCDDGNWCTAGDSCAGGSCSGGPRNCDDQNDCTQDDCDSANNQCTHTWIPEPGAEGIGIGNSCSNNLDDDCDQLTDMADPNCHECELNADCQDNNDCTDDVCAQGKCQYQQVANGTPCDDSAWCTDVDVCKNGVCTGSARDCGDLTNACNDGLCDEPGDSCFAQPKPDGTACSDSNWCTVEDSCLAGVCKGSPRDCSDSDFCTQDSCNAQGHACLHTPAPRPEYQDICGDAVDQDCDGVTDGCCLGGESFVYFSKSNVGSNPWHMLVADFNQDGISDLATVNTGDHTLAVLLGKGAHGRGDGTFDAKLSYTTGNTPYGVAAADLNTDGILDLITANNGGNSLSIHWGQGSNGKGNGTFANRTDISFAPILANPTQVAVGDFNADSIADLISANWSADNVGVFLGQGTNGKASGTFSAPAFYGVGANGLNPRSLRLGDFDADGILDVAVGNWYGGKVSILKGGGLGGKGDGSFSLLGRYDAGTNHTDVAAVDFNADGILDLAVVSMGLDVVNILLGQGQDGRGDGTFGAPMPVSTGDTPVSVAPADLNRDGILDLVVAEWGVGSVGVLLGQGANGRWNGTFGARLTFGVGGQPSMALPFDATGDNLLDIASADYGPDRVTLLRSVGSGGMGDGGFVTFGTIPSGHFPQSISAIDLNSDRILDLVLAYPEDNSLGVYIGQGANGRGKATFVPGWTSPSGSKPQGVFPADVDGDRIVDLLVANSMDNNIGVFLGGGSGGQGTGDFAHLADYPAGTEPTGLALLDLNADALPDLLSVSGLSGIGVRLGNGSEGVPDGSFGELALSAAGHSSVAMAWGDINSDGISDVVVANQADDTVSVFLGAGLQGQGTGGFTPYGEVAVGDEPTHVLLVDLNQDSLLDLVVANHGSSNLSIRPGQGSNGQANGTFGPGGEAGVGIGPRMVAAADFNSDGLLDLATANSDSATVSILMGLGNCAFLPAQQLAVGSSPVSLAVGQLDWDGRLDLVIGDSVENSLIVLRGTGSCGSGN